VAALLHKLSPRFILFVMVGSTSMLNYAFALVMGWLLKPGDYGLLAFGQSLLLVGGMVLGSGFSWSLARDMVKTDGPGERDVLVRGALLANFLLATTMSVILVVLFAAGPLKDGFERWPVVIVVALALPFMSLLSIARGCAQGSERFGIFSSIGVTEVSGKMISGAALALLGFGAIGALAGFLVGAVCSTTLGFRQLTRAIGVRLRGKMKLPNVRGSMAIFGALLGLSMLLSLDLIGLKLLSQERALVGYYQAGLVLANAPYYLVVSAMLPVLFVQLARYENISATQGSLGETLGLTVALILPFELVLMIFPREALVTFLPNVYAPGAPALRILALGNMLLILAAIFSAVFQAIGRAKTPARIVLAVVLAEPFALWAIVPHWHAVGAAWVFTGAAFLALLCLVAAYLRQSGLECLRQVAPWVLRYALAVGAALIFGRLALGLGVAPAVFIGGVCYLIAATLLRIIRPLAILPVGASMRKPATSGKK